MNKLKKILNREVPFLSSVKNRLLLIGFVATYAILFIVLYEPFNINQWGSNYYWQFIIGGTVILFITQFGLRWLFKIKKFRYYGLFLWYVLEVILIAYVFYVLFGDELSAYKEKIKEYLLTFRYTGLVMIVPYASFVWYMEHQYRLQGLKDRQEELIYASGKDSEEKLLTVMRENGHMALAVKYSQLVYIKSAGNYLEIFYLKGDKLTKELVRGSVKDFESKIIDSQHIIRVHRSYLINVNHLSSTKKTKKGYALIMRFVPEEVIPVSSSYKPAFENALK